MSGQLIELIIFAAIAFFIINKLLATLGSTERNKENKRADPIFGNVGSVKDVTATDAKHSKEKLKAKFTKILKTDIKNVIVPGQEENIVQSLEQIRSKIPNFSPSSFVKKAKLAFEMIVNAKERKEQETLEELIDKRYLSQFNSIINNYGEFNKESENFKAYISEIYLFGNNVFVKILFTGQNATTKIKNLHEEWSFTKSLLENKSTWYLTNIDQPH